MKAPWFKIKYPIGLLGWWLYLWAFFDGSQEQYDTLKKYEIEELAKKLNR